MQLCYISKETVDKMTRQNKKNRKKDRKSGRGRKDERAQEIRASEKAECERTCKKSESERDTDAFVSVHFPNWLNLKAVCSRAAAHVTTCNVLSSPSSNSNKKAG